MKKMRVLLLATALSAVVSGSVFADPTVVGGSSGTGVLTFKGHIDAATCKVDTAHQTWDMGTMTYAAASSQYYVYGRKDMSLGISGCPNTQTKATVTVSYPNPSGVYQTNNSTDDNKDSLYSYITPTMPTGNGSNTTGAYSNGATFDVDINDGSGVIPAFVTVNKRSGWANVAGPIDFTYNFSVDFD